MRVFATSATRGYVAALGAKPVHGCTCVISVGVLDIVSPPGVASVTGASVVASALATKGLLVNRIHFPRTLRGRDAQFPRSRRGQAVPLPSGRMEIGSLVPRRRDAVIGKRERHGKRFTGWSWARESCCEIGAAACGKCTALDVSARLWTSRNGRSCRREQLLELAHVQTGRGESHANDPKSSGAPVSTQPPSAVRIEPLT